GQNMRGNVPGTFDPFEPETVTDYEVGMKADFLDSRVRANLAAFTSDYKDAQREVFSLFPDGSTGSLTTNAGAATINGFEADLTLLPLDNLTINATIAYLDASYDEFVDFSGDRSNEP